MANEKCCFDGDDGQCGKPAEWAIYDEDPNDPYSGTHTCAEHVGVLLRVDRYSTVCPIGFGQPAKAA